MHNTPENRWRRSEAEKQQYIELAKRRFARYRSRRKAGKVTEDFSEQWALVGLALVCLIVTCYFLKKLVL